jgi:hypothetical protein
MSSLWTPSGEHPVEPDRPDAEPAPAGVGDTEPPDPAAEEIDELRRQLAAAPVEVVITNHCYGLFELAAVHLSQSPPQLVQAQMAIDALGFVVAGLGERLGEAQASLQEALTQVRLAFVQMEAAERARDEVGGPAAN